MTYLVTDNCVKCKHTTCVSVCPVDCFYEGENMLVIHPDECIDCGVCQPECPVQAISVDTDLGDQRDYWESINRKHANVWSNITEEKEPLPDAEAYDGVLDKYKKFVEKSIPIKEEKSDELQSC